MMNLAHQQDHGPLIFSRNAPTVRALKADTLPPLWWRDTLQLAALLRAAWRAETSDYFKQLSRSFEKQDAQAIERALGVLPEIGPRLVKRLGKLPDAIMLNVQQKAHAFWALHGKEAGVDTGPALKRDYEEKYQRKLAEVAATQVKTFAEAHPERIVNDEIKRQIAYLNESKLTRAGDVARLNQRLERITSQKHNFEGMSSVHVSRLWQADGVMLAAENGVATLIGTGPTDQKCCPVCLHLVGIEVNVTDAVAKIKGDMGITDPDDYVGAWKFPRIKDIDNMSPQEVAAYVGPLPFPAHLRCRHSYTWGTLTKGAVTGGRRKKPVRGKGADKTKNKAKTPKEQTPKTPRGTKKPKRQRLDDSALLTDRELMVQRWTEAGVKTFGEANGFSYDLKIAFARDLREHGLISAREYDDILFAKGSFPQHAESKYLRYVKRIEKKRPDDFTQWPDGFHWDAKNSRFVVYRRKKFKDYRDINKWLDKYGISELGVGVDGAFSAGTQTEIMTNIGVTRHLRRYMSPGMDKPVNKFTWKSDLGPRNDRASALYWSGSRNIDIKSDIQARLPLRPEPKPNVDVRRSSASIQGQVTDYTINENKKVIRRLRTKFNQTGALTEQDQLDLLEYVGRNKYLERSKRQIVFSNRQFYEDALVHEYGHHWHYTVDHVIKDIFGVSAKDWHGLGVDKLRSKKAASIWAPSEYGATNFTETIAESYMSYFAGKIDMIHPDIVNLFDCLFPELQFGRRMLPGIFGPVMKNSNEVAAKLELIKRKIQKKAKDAGLFDSNPSVAKLLDLN